MLRRQARHAETVQVCLYLSFQLFQHCMPEGSFAMTNTLQHAQACVRTMLAVRRYQFLRQASITLQRVCVIKSRDVLLTALVALHALMCSAFMNICCMRCLRSAQHPCPASPSLNFTHTDRWHGVTVCVAPCTAWCASCRYLLHNVSGSFLPSQFQH